MSLGKAGRVPREAEGVPGSKRTFSCRRVGGRLAPHPGPAGMHMVFSCAASLCSSETLSVGFAEILSWAFYPPLPQLPTQKTRESSFHCHPLWGI